MRSTLRAPTAPNRIAAMVGWWVLGSVLCWGSGAWRDLPLQSDWAGGHREVWDPPSEPPQLQVDLNQATWPELALLPGISQVLGGRIIEARDREGPFRSVGELMRVPGIGPATVSQLRPFVVCSSSVPKNP